MINHPRILIPITRGHMARLLVYSGVIEQIADHGAQLIILTPEGPNSSLINTFSTGNVTFDYLPQIGYRFAQLWDHIHRYFFLTLIPTYSSEARLASIKVKEPRRYRLITALPHPAMRLMERIWGAIRRLVLPAHLYACAFDKHKPDLVITGSMGRTFEDFILLRYAKLRHLRTLCTIQSWDTLTTKEFGFEHPQRLLVWNSANKQTAVNVFNYDQDQVAVVGVPQFDFYLKSSSFESRAEWLARYGLDPKRELLLVTGQGGHIHSNLHEVVETLAYGIANSVFVKPIQVLVRPHPAVYFGDVTGQGTESDLQAYEALNPHIKCNRPVRSSARLSTDTAASEHLVLANNLFHAAMLIDFYGTLAVEACVMNRPVVYADVRSSFAQETDSGSAHYDGIDYRQYEHLQYIFSMKGTRTAFNRQELVDLINRYLCDPTLDIEGRRAIAEAFCYKIDGRSSERMAETIYRYAQGIWLVKPD